MQDIAEQSVAAASTVPSRLHHTAWVVEDQARTRAFYEEGLGFKLTAFWIEKVKDPEAGEVMTFSHAFYGMEDGGALAFFCMDDPKHKEKFKSPVTQVFNHVALNVDDAVQGKMLDRLKAADLPHHFIDHGYCRSLYVVDPDGFRLEFTVDSPDVERINSEQLRDADMWFKRWTEEGYRGANNHIFVGHEREHAAAE